jgi:hypothetical protein
LEAITGNLERLRQIWGDYHVLAAKPDDDYKTWSPRLHEETNEAGRIDIPLDLEVLQWTDQSHVKALRDSASALFSWITSKPRESRWATFDRGRLTVIVADFRKGNTPLRELVPVCSATVVDIKNSSVEVSVEQLKDLAEQSHIMRLGLRPHFELRQLSLDSSIDEDDYGLKEMEYKALENTGPMMRGEMRSTGSLNEKKDMLFEYKDYSTDDPDGTTNAWQEPVKELAGRLAILRTPGLMGFPLRGYMRESGLLGKHRYVFFFDIPANIDVSSRCSLDEIIERRHLGLRPDLFSRFRIAKRLALIIIALHSDGWLHQSIRSSSVLFLNAGDFVRPKLVNFEYCRREKDATRFSGFDSDFGKNLYRHPERQGAPHISFEEKHDIYAPWFDSTRDRAMACFERALA